jgi:hypothetical protein
MNTITKVFSIIKTLGLPALVLAVWLLEVRYSKNLFYSGDYSITRKSGSTKPYDEAIAIRSPSRTLSQILGINSNKSSKCIDKSPTKIWIAPYRRFPEVPPEGNSRGLGDYEYLSLLTSDTCSSFRANYGAFKNSPADKVFSNASSTGISKELSLASELGFEWFILDLNKVYLSSERFFAECKKTAQCFDTSDNFVAISIKQPETARLFGSLLTTTSRKLNKNTKDILSDHLFYRATGWHEIEIQSDGSALAWSKSRDIGDSVEFGGTKIQSLPINSDIVILPGPSVKDISLQLNCADGNKKTINKISTPRSIGSNLRTCQPVSVSIREFRLANNAINDNRISSKLPMTGPSDTRLSAFGIMVIER